MANLLPKRSVVPSVLYDLVVVGGTSPLFYTTLGYTEVFEDSEYNTLVVENSGAIFYVVPGTPNEALFAEYDALAVSGSGSVFYAPLSESEPTE